MRHTIIEMRWCQSGYRVHVSNLAVRVSRRAIERTFKKYGTLNEACFLFDFD